MDTTQGVVIVLALILMISMYFSITTSKAAQATAAQDAVSVADIKKQNAINQAGIKATADKLTADWAAFQASESQAMADQAAKYQSAVSATQDNYNKAIADTTAQVAAIKAANDKAFADQAAVISAVSAANSQQAAADHTTAVGDHTTLMNDHSSILSLLQSMQAATDASNAATANLTSQTAGYVTSAQQASASVQLAAQQAAAKSVTQCIFTNPADGKSYSVPPFANPTAQPQRDYNASQNPQTCAALNPNPNGVSPTACPNKNCFTWETRIPVSGFVFSPNSDIISAEANASCTIL